MAHCSQTCQMAIMLMLQLNNVNNEQMIYYMEGLQ